MKAERGITLIILSIYVIVFSIIIALLANLSSYIYRNLDNVSDSTIDLSEFNKFNMYFIEDVKTKDIGEIPMAIRNAPIEKMKELGYSQGYLYPHDFPGHYVEQQYLPDKMLGTKYYIKDENIE